jgi:hypothetical protein
MAVTFADYLEFMQTSDEFEMIARFEFLNPDETAYQSFSAEVTGGSLSINRVNGVRRSINISVHNKYDTFTPDPLRFWVNQKFKLYLGYKIDGEDYFLPQGVFILRNPSTVRDLSSKTAALSGIDKFSLMDGQLNGRLDATYNITLGTSVKTAIKAILATAAVNDPTTPLLIVGSDITPYTIYKEFGGTYGDVILELNNIIAYNMFYDPDGRFNCLPDVLNSLKMSSWDFNTNSKIYLPPISQEYLYEQAYNTVMVVGDNVNGSIATGTATNNDPSSPFSVFHIGARLAPPITNAICSTDAQAQALAEYELKRYASLAINATISCIPLFHLDVDQIVTVTDDEASLDNERFLINSINIPLDPKGGNRMTINATKASDIDFEITVS